MRTQKQIFQTSSPVRWKTFQWISRTFLFLLLLIVPVIWISLLRGYKPALPLLESSRNITKVSPINPKGFTKKEIRKYKGFTAFLKARQRNASLMAAEKKKKVTQRIRAGFFVDWDPQAFSSLQSHIGDLNMVIPEWFFLDPAADTLKPQIDPAALQLMKAHQVRILPILNNVNTLTHDGNFDGALLDRVLRNKHKRQQLEQDVLRYLTQYQLQGINVDFEELKPSTIAPMHLFLKELYEKLHPKGYLVTQDIMPNDEDYHLKELAASNDYLFLMAYDQHWGGSVPGAVSDQKWIEEQMDVFAKDVPPEKIVLGLAAFGYDWPAGGEGVSVTYQQALSNARQHHAAIDFDNNSYNCSYSYSDADSVKHTVYFADAGGNFNSIRFADQYGAAGVALWRLGSEDERLWNFYSRDLDNASMVSQPFNFSQLHSLDITAERPDYFGNGEVLDVVSSPEKGIIDIEHDSTDNLVSEETYRQLPTRYVIDRYGVVNNQVVLTFDDGPDPEYTPRILDILKKENVPATFFIVGINGENHLPLLKRIYRDGFEIGNHSFTHPNIAEVSPARAEAEMEATRLLIEAATGHSTILFRAPYNADSEPQKLVELMPVERGKTNHYYTVGESIDPEDWNTEDGINADSIYNRVVRQYEANPQKGIILFHDAGGNREATVQALPRIIHYFKNKGVQFTGVSTLLHLPKDAIMPPVHDQVVKLNGWITSFLYLAGRCLTVAFWLAIILGLARILLLGTMATIRYSRTKKMNALPAVADVPVPVSIIVPAYNEEVNAVKTITNLLKQDYANFDIVFVDDGSTDTTYQKVLAAFGHHPRVRVLTKPNGGKASALNLGISHTQSEFVVCIDADTQLMPDAVSKLMDCFRDAQTGAVAGNVKVGNRRNILTNWQSIEYTTAQNFDRYAFDLINAITVVPGAIGAFRREAIRQAGGFTSDTLAEDCDLTIRILRQGYTIRNCATAIAITEAPETLKQFMRQRFRWTYGVMQSFWKNRDACFNPRYKGLGMVALPNIFLFQIVMPLIGPFADILFFLSLYINRDSPESMHKIMLFYAVFLLVDVMVSVLAFSFEKEKISRLVWLIPQRFIYRLLMYVVLFRSVRKAIKGESQGWGVLKRTGNVVIAGQSLQGNG
jgi:cellulose synthase/poly-beta-1,6-N-acetylglucosamine synthase-like glycosyltransferase/spore germination protein YaaH/peptidoglycan/xylan/chitin deacetylase (PgdA/CDA1 family)